MMNAECLGYGVQPLKLPGDKELLEGGFAPAKEPQPQRAAERSCSTFYSSFASPTADWAFVADFAECVEFAGSQCWQCWRIREGEALAEPQWIEWS
jgi:hypothetical protein